MDFSPFNRISAELRNRIYEFVLCTLEPIEIELEDMEHAVRGPHLVRPACRRRPANFLNAPTIPDCPFCDPAPRTITGYICPYGHDTGILSLTRTCRQIRHEALPIFLSENKFRILAHLAIGSAHQSEVQLIAQAIFRCCASFGSYATCMRKLEIFLGDNHDDDYDPALPLRRSLIREVNRMFFSTCIQPSITMELELPAGSRTVPGLRGPVQLGSPAVPPIRLDSTQRSRHDNQHAIEFAVGHARDVAFQYGYATPQYLNGLAARRARAFLVLETLTTSSA